MIRELFEFVGVTEFHHGACIGADAEAVAILDRMREGGWGCKIIAYPGDWGPLTDANSLKCSDLVHTCRPMLERNRSIVNASDKMIACPRTMDEEQRSGTWATIRFTQRQGKDIAIVWPDGTVTIPDQMLSIIYAARAKARNE